MEKKKSKLRHIPNILSLSRIPVSIAMMFLAKINIYAFLVTYAVAGINDVLDGLIARRFHWESKLGAKIDSIGDVVFLLCAVVAVIFGVEEIKLHPSIYVAVGVIALVRGVNALFTRIKFKQWGFIHNLFVKYASVPIFFIIPISILMKKVPNTLLLAMLVLIVLASVEETWILKVMDDYDMNMKSIYHMKKTQKAKGAGRRRAGGARGEPGQLLPRAPERREESARPARVGLADGTRQSPEADT